MHPSRLGERHDGHRTLRRSRPAAQARAPQSSRLRPHARLLPGIPPRRVTGAEPADSGRVSQLHSAKPTTGNASSEQGTSRSLAWLTPHPRRDPGLRPPLGRRSFAPAARHSGGRTRPASRSHPGASPRPRRGPARPPPSCTGHPARHRAFRSVLRRTPKAARMTAKSCRGSPTRTRGASSRSNRTSAESTSGTGMEGGPRDGNHRADTGPVLAGQGQGAVALPPRRGREAIRDLALHGQEQGLEEIPMANEPENQGRRDVVRDVGHHPRAAPPRIVVERLGEVELQGIGRPDGKPRVAAQSLGQQPSELPVQLHGQDAGAGPEHGLGQDPRPGADLHDEAFGAEPRRGHDPVAHPGSTRKFCPRRRRGRRPCACSSACVCDRREARAGSARVTRRPPGRPRPAPGKCGRADAWD